MKFKEYNSIENSYRKRFVANCVDAIKCGYCEDDFLVEEKAHGANFSFYYDGNELQTASRHGFLEDDGEKFFKSHLVKERYAPAIRNLFALIGCSTAIRVVGELIGGSYEHPDTKDETQHRDLPRIQKGVDYCPGHEFYAFDLYVLSDKPDSTGTTRYTTTVDRLKMNRLFEQAGLFYAKPLFRGTLEECLAFDNTFKSRIPVWLGLPEHPKANIAEGKVIKPIKIATLRNGARIILKHKAECFEEVAFGQKRTAKADKAKPTNLSRRGEILEDILLAHITENRLSNVLSKLSEECTINDAGRLCRLLCHDAMEEFKKDYIEAYDELDPKEQKIIRKNFGTRGISLVHEILSKSSPQ